MERLPSVRSTVTVRSMMGSLSVVTSSSALTTCWLCAITRSLVVVGLSAPVTTLPTSTPLPVRSDSSSLPASSSPTTPTSFASAPNDATFSATLAAAPNLELRRLTSTIGTGASCEILLTSPQT